MKKIFITLMLLSLPVVFVSAQANKGKTGDDKPKTEQQKKDSAMKIKEQHEQHEHHNQKDTFHKNNPIKGGEVKDKGPENKEVKKTEEIKEKGKTKKPAKAKKEKKEKVKKEKKTKKVKAEDAEDRGDSKPGGEPGKSGSR